VIEIIDLIRPGAGRGLDFIILDELRKRTGITKPEIVKFAMSEMLANSLDTDATEIWIKVSKEDEFDEVTVTDNGSTKITSESLESCPCPDIWEQDLHNLLEELCFVDFLVIGRWNYDSRARTPEARMYYQGAVNVFREFCTDHGIRYC